MPRKQSRRKEHETHIKETQNGGIEKKINEEITAKNALSQQRLSVHVPVGHAMLAGDGDVFNSELGAGQLYEEHVTAMMKSCSDCRGRRKTIRGQKNSRSAKKNVDGWETFFDAIFPGRGKTFFLSVNFGQD